MPIISKFTARTNGSFVKLSHSSIGWSYYSCDPEWGSLQASYLVVELEEALQSFDVRFEALKGIVEGKCKYSKVDRIWSLCRHILNVAVSVLQSGTKERTQRSHRKENSTGHKKSKYEC